MNAPIPSPSLLRLGLWPRLGLAVALLLPLWAAFWWAL
jgi:hypothetical protein